MQGLGKYTFASGNTYIGQYSMGKREGMGRYKWQNSGQLYNGMWEDDRRSGSGTHFWDDAALYQVLPLLARDQLGTRFERQEQ
jgi:1-phosphatidylinositol-4-phosphate 5-kinase